MASNLDQMIIIHRHGARYPLKQIIGDLLWPINKEFWDRYKGHLTPVGSLQLINIGKDLRSYYSEFISNLDTHLIRIHSSNSQRTITSAWSFLTEIFPDKSKYIKNMGDIQYRNMNYEIKDHIAIHIETELKTDKLFHLGKSNYNIKNLSSSILLEQSALNDEYTDLCNRLYRMTLLPKLNPSFSIKDRLFELKYIHTQIKIAVAHNLEILPNTNNEILTTEDLEKIDIIGNENFHIITYAELKKSDQLPNGNLWSVRFRTEDIDLIFKEL